MADNDCIPMAPPSYAGVMNEEPPRKLELSLWQKLAELNDLVGDYIQKDGTNTAQKYKYISEGKVLSKVKPAMHEARLVSIPTFELISSEDKATSNGSIWKLVTIRCTLRIYDIDSAEFVEVVAIGQGIDANDKAAAKAQTQAMKYAYWKLLCLETGDDPEADEKTDQQQFVPPSQQTENPWTRLQNLWNMSRFPPAELNGYLCRRFSKTTVDQILPHELDTVSNELTNNLRAQGIFM